ncbi:MAG: SURF1 family protein [Pseudomonadota bacterium]
MTSPSAGGHRPRWVQVIVICCCAVVFLTLVALGNWQVQRLSWKHDLVAAVDARAFGEAVPAPIATDLDLEASAYLRVFLEGRFQHAHSRRVKALTALGAGFWLMTPLETAQGHVWVNRGFVPTGIEPGEVTTPTQAVRLEGLLRPTEPDGTLLEKNDPVSGRWYSRDVDALSRDAGIRSTVSYFIDADHTDGPDGFPRGGLTVIKFRNSHLAYALTWYAMAALLLGAVIYLRFARRPSA